MQTAPKVAVSIGVIKPSNIAGHRPALLRNSGESRRYERVLNTMDETLESSNLGNDSKPDHVANRTGSGPGGASGQHPSAHEQPSGGPGGNAQCASGPGGDRRKRRRALISAPIRVRAVRARVGVVDGPDEVSTTLDVSRNGVLFVGSQRAFAVGMEVAVTFPYTKTPQFALLERTGRVVRISELPDGRRSVAIALSASGEKAIAAATHSRRERVDCRKPLVLIVDADPSIRASLKVYLSTEGYEVFAVSCAGEAHEVLKLFTPALLIAEIEGDDLPGFELCAHCKATPRLRTVPVVLLTRSAYPSDYANAHSLGAVVCMAKPYRQERLGHIVRLLAPTEEHKQVVPVRPIDPTRRCRLPQRKGEKKGSSMCDSVEHRPPWRV